MKKVEKFVGTKLSSKDITKIKAAYKKGMSIRKINEKFPDMSEHSIRYWSYSRNRELAARRANY